MIKLETITAARKGRPRVEDRATTAEALKPWLALGISRRTYYVMKSQPDRKIELDRMLKQCDKGAYTAGDGNGQIHQSSDTNLREDSISVARDGGNLDR